MMPISQELQASHKEHLRRNSTARGSHGVHVKWLRYCLHICRKYQFALHRGGVCSVLLIARLAEFLRRCTPEARHD
jgi:hypothetical protein